MGHILNLAMKLQCFTPIIMLCFVLEKQIMTPWRNGSASDSRSEGCVFESRRGQAIFFIFFFITAFSDQELLIFKELSG